MNFQKSTTSWVSPSAYTLITSSVPEALTNDLPLTYLETSSSILVWRPSGAVHWRSASAVDIALRSWNEKSVYFLFINSTCIACNVPTKPGNRGSRLHCNTYLFVPEYHFSLIILLNWIKVTSFSYFQQLSSIYLKKISFFLNFAPALGTTHGKDIVFYMTGDRSQIKILVERRSGAKNIFFKFIILF